ncbi:glyoxylate reductase/hydroxypyruvate reductase-like [Plakobranchus ocellatus]|uniref:Glyoxylate reductase/hydroxypyruvate reductase n=1 Tax=Plakobranchus ocellatus TaxID=259542 RepID=A0AAV4C5H4_9GAST|nr:glyoxylate reductase/hydroxypyruvate reductase-like [Plakobranchus ocellatus]
MASTSYLPRVFVTRSAPAAGLARLGQHCHMTVHEKENAPTREELLQGVRGMDALFVHPSTRIDKEVLDAAGPQLKVIGTYSVGLDHIDLDLCKERSIKVSHTPGVLTTATAELAVTLVLATAKRLEECIRAVKEGVWGTRWENALWLVGKQISGSVVGIVGLGRIGLAIAERLAAFGLSKIVYTGRAPKPESADPIGAEFLSFDELLKQSDFVIVSCSVDESNKNIFNTGAFKKMKPSSIFVNVSRGAIVDQKALYEALKSGQIGAAGLDVTTPEPLPPSDPLLTLPNCLVVPHIGSLTDSTRNIMCELVVDNILAGLEGRPLLSPAF